MWSYYGAKTNIIDHYPTPKFDKIIEPFAGSARYALKYFDRDVILLDKYEVIYKIWQWLQQCSTSDILNLPIPVAGQTTDDLVYDCEEAKLLTGFIISFGAYWPCKKPSKYVLVERPNAVKYSLNRIAGNLYKIKHWTILHGDYMDLINEKATWFIDPPYEEGGYRYVESGKNINYVDLAKWCSHRSGQVIVCEKTSATWMKFKPMIIQETSTGKHQEGIWSNMPTVFDNEQLDLFNEQPNVHKS